MSTQRKTANEAIISQSNVQVVRFDVWQDLTPASRSTAPVHASFTLRLSDTYSVSLGAPAGTIRLESPDGAELSESKIVVSRALCGIGMTMPGRKEVQFAMMPTPMYGRLDKLQAVRGTAFIKVGERLVSIRLPETRVIFAW